MASKKLDLRGNNDARNAVEKDVIQNNETIDNVVQMTKKAISKKPKSEHIESTSIANNSVDTVVEKIAGVHTVAEFKKVPTASLVPAPIEWNYFSALPDEKKSLMAESIYYNGLLQPIIVRSLNQDNTKYEILAGHHRTEAYAVLYEITGDQEYLEIEARVFPYNSLTDAQAREIVEDTNFVQRGNLSSKDKAMCIYNKAKALRERGTKGDILDMVAGHFGVTRATAFFWKKLVDLIPEFDAFFSEGHINLVSASKIAGFPTMIQKELYAHKELVTNEAMAKVKAKDDPSEVLNKLKKYAEPNAGNYYGNIVKTEDQGEGMTITVSQKPQTSMRPVLMYLPEDKYESFQKKYKEYIITTENK